MRRRRASSLGAVIAIGAITLVSASTAVARTGTVRPAAAYQQCSDPYAIASTHANPLGLSPAPGANPLSGARFFVDGPRHGLAAGAIVQLLGLDPNSFPDSYSWADLEQALGLNPLTYHDNYSFAVFQQALASGPYAKQIAAKAAADPQLEYKLFQLSKIADQPEAQRFSEFSGGGTPAGITQQVIKLFCYNLTADPGSIPIIETFFVYPHGQYCPTLQEMLDNWSTFKAQIAAMAAGIGSHAAVLLLELDSIGSSACLHTETGGTTAPTKKKQHKKHKPRHSKPKPGHAADLTAHPAAAPDCGSGNTTRLSMWECELRYEVDTVAALPRLVVYTEAGYSDGTDAGWAAKILNAIDIANIRGFYTNDTHNAWTINEVNWAEGISKATGGAHFIVNTAQNGQGPLVPPNRVKYGNEVTCNPVGRGIGPRVTTQTGVAGADAFLWTFVPGRSSGDCSGVTDCTHLANVCELGGPSPGDFWLSRAVELASHADSRLGPTYPSQPY